MGVPGLSSLEQTANTDFANRVRTFDEVVQDVSHAGAVCSAGGWLAGRRCEELLLDLECSKGEWRRCMTVGAADPGDLGIKKRDELLKIAGLPCEAAALIGQKGE